jgi:hypothetical protein
MNYQKCELSGLSVDPFDCSLFNGFKEPCEQTKQDKMSDNKLKYDSLKNGFIDIKTKIADGSSTQLINTIKQGNSINPDLLYSLLITNSPYLSNEALLDMLQYATQLSSTQKVNVLIANAGLQQVVLDAINSYGFSQTELFSINAAQQTNYPALDDAYSRFNYLYSEMVNAKNDAILTANILSSTDTINNWTDSIITFLQAESSIDVETKKQLIGTCYAANRYDECRYYLSTLSNDNSTEITDFINYYQLLLNAIDEGRNEYTLSENEWNTLTELAAHNSAAAESAKGLLSLVQGKVFDLYIERLNEPETLEKRSTTVVQETFNDTKSAKLKIYPNPSNSLVNVNYVLTQFKRNVLIRVIDITGKEIYQQQSNALQSTTNIATENWSNGMYFVQILGDGEVMGTQKLLIQH